MAPKGLEKYSPRYTEPLASRMLGVMTKHASSVQAVLAQKAHGKQADASEPLKELFLWRNSVLYALLADPPGVTEKQFNEMIVEARVKGNALQPHLERIAIAAAMMVDGLFSDGDDDCYIAPSKLADQLHCSIDFVMKRGGRVRPTKVFAVLDPNENDAGTTIGVATDLEIFGTKLVGYEEHNHVINSLIEADVNNSMMVGNYELGALSINELACTCGLSSVYDLETEDDDRIAVLTRIREQAVAIVSKSGSSNINLPADKYLQLRTLFNYLSAYDDLRTMNYYVSKGEEPQVVLVSVTYNEPAEKFREKLLQKEAVENRDH